MTGLAPGNGFEYVVGVIRFIGHDRARGLGQGRQQRGQLPAVGRLAWREHQVQAVAERVDDGMPFRREAAPATA